MKNKSLNKKTSLKILGISLLSLAIIGSVIGIIIIKSGKDGINGTNGNANNVSLIDGKVAVDGNKTSYENEDLSEMINVSSNNSDYGSVSESDRYPLNSAVKIVACPNNGYIFSHWEDKDANIISKNSTYLTKATSYEQYFKAIFEVDKDSIVVSINVRGDSTLPSKSSFDGYGDFKYGQECKITVTNENPNAFDNANIVFYEVNKEQYVNLNYNIDKNKMIAISIGSTFIFNIDSINDRYFIATLEPKEQEIVIVVSSTVNLSVSHNEHATASIIKVNGDEYKENETIIFPGYDVIVEASPISVIRYNNLAGSDYDRFYKVPRSEFLYWIDLDNGEIVSYDKQYSFIAKSNVNLKAVFKPKTVVYFKGYLDYIIYISSNKIGKTESMGYGTDMAIGSFDYNETLICYAYFNDTRVGGSYYIRRTLQYYWEISYDEINYSTLTYNKQCRFKIPENLDFIYLRLSEDKIR